jgi:hypothetical protein
MIHAHDNCPKCHKPSETSEQMFPGYTIPVNRCEKCIQYAVVGDEDWLDGLLVGIGNMSRRLFERAQMLEAKKTQEVSRKPEKVRAEA